MSKATPIRISPARSVAFDVLLAVETGSYASDDLRARSVTLSPRDAGLAGQIVFGCLRWQAQLDFLLESYSARTAQSLDGVVRIALRAGIFQLRFLERIPPHAAVHDAVEFVKKRQRAAAGLVNAVLRKVKRDPVAWPKRSIELSCPEWLLRRWQHSFGEEKANAMGRAALREPRRYVRLPQPIPGLALEETPLPGCFRVPEGAPRLDPKLRFQDIGSQSIVPHLDLRPGHRFLDVCSAPGNKMAQALEVPLGLAVACDVSLERIRSIAAPCARVALDATEPLPFNIQFDRILVDAPCSGTGTLAANPEIKWRLRPADFERFQEKQVKILKNALDALAPAGKLVYATCSLEHEENEDVVAAALAGAGGRWQCSRQVYRLPGQDEGDGFFAAIIDVGQASPSACH